MFWEGIPVIYYGDEQYFNGRGDPYCREALWENGYKTDTKIYKYYKIGLHYRKTIELWNKNVTQLACSKEYYSFKRFDPNEIEYDVLVAIITVGQFFKLNLKQAPKVYIPSNKIDKYSNITI